MNIEIAEEDASSLAAYSSVPIAFRVYEVLDLDSTPDAESQFPRRTLAVVPPYIKDYDAYPGNSPLDWPTRFDITEWGFLAAYVGAQRVGGAVMVTRDPRIHLLDGCEYRALLWDLRVAPLLRHHGVGSALLRAAEEWARARMCDVIDVETQNTNVPACRFYARHGFALKAANRSAYPELPEDVQLLWHKDLLGSHA